MYLRLFVFVKSTSLVAKTYGFKLIFAICIASSKGLGGKGVSEEDARATKTQGGKREEEEEELLTCDKFLERK